MQWPNLNPLNLSEIALSLNSAINSHQYIKIDWGTHTINLVDDKAKASSFKEMTHLIEQHLKAPPVAQNQEALTEKKIDVLQAYSKMIEAYQQKWSEWPLLAPVIYIFQYIFGQAREVNKAEALVKQMYYQPQHGGIREIKGDGYIKENKLNGLGKITTAFGSIYQGEFKDDVLEGEGMILSHLGFIKEKGVFKDGVLQEGVQFEENKISKGTFRDGRLLKGEVIEKRGEEFFAYEFDNGERYHERTIEESAFESVQARAKPRHVSWQDQG